MRLKVLGSGSSGNGYLLDNGKEALMIEAGVRFAEAKRALGFGISRIAGCLISHEHGDHAGHLREVLEAAVPVFASRGTLEKAGLPDRMRRAATAVEAGRMFRAGGFRIIPFDTRHDSAQPFGFYINHEETGNVLFATDTYYLPFTFEGLNNILIECNYRPDILDGNIASGRVPAVVRERVIRSHFSYGHCLQALLANDLRAVNNIVLIHLSGNNADAAEFREGIRQATGKRVFVAEAGMTIDFDRTPF